MYKQLLVRGNMINYLYTDSCANSGSNYCASKPAKSVNPTNPLHYEHYINMDLCSQAQMSEDADNILNRMDKLRAFAREQQAKRGISQRQQTSFCF
jgi:hypothetical protein